jgi:hypothetical protein
MQISKDWFIPKPQFSKGIGSRYTATLTDPSVGRRIARQYSGESHERPLALDPNNHAHHTNVELGIDAKTIYEHVRAGTDTSETSDRSIVQTRKPT